MMVGDSFSKEEGRSLPFTRLPSMTGRARHLRKNVTNAEQKIWFYLRRNQLSNLYFRRQTPVGPYILDFYCHELGLAIELDGGQHDDDQHRTRDAHRTQWLQQQGIFVIRFWNNDVMRNIEGVLQMLSVHIEELKRERKC
jgi:very-short-patch-repair endonuclease